MSAQPSQDRVDPIGQAGTRAKGRRPYFFSDPDVERVLAITMSVAMEHAVTRQRLDALERLLEARGVLSRAELEQFRPDAAAERERGVWMQEYIARVLRIVQQEGEAAGGAVEPPVEAVTDDLRHS